LDED
jgi:hypothetical protein